MKKVFQTDVSKTGNCLDACCASILEIPLEACKLPSNKKQTPKYIELMQSRGYEVVVVNLPFATLTYPDGNTRSALGDFLSRNKHLFGYCVVSVDSGRHKGGLHAVVGFIDKGDFRIIHDPNPACKGKNLIKHWHYKINALDILIAKG